MQPPPGLRGPHPLGPADLGACLALDRIALKGLWTPEQWERELTDESRLVLGLEDEESDLIALAAGWLVADELQITAVAVAPHQRKRGLGTLIVKALIQRGQLKGAVEANLDVSSNNPAAIALYESLGFVTTGFRRDYYRDGSDALLQRLKIKTGRDIHTEQTENP